MDTLHEVKKPSEKTRFKGDGWLEGICFRILETEKKTQFCKNGCFLLQNRHNLAVEIEAFFIFLMLHVTCDNNVQLSSNNC